MANNCGGAKSSIAKGKALAGFDTETVDGQAILCACAINEGSELIYWPKSARGLLGWLLLLPDCVGWNSSYDARAIIAWLPAGARELLAVVGRASYCGYRLRYIEGKLFEVVRRRRIWRLYDACQFFGLSLDAAAVAYLGERKLRHDVTPTGIYRALLTRQGRNTLAEYCARDADLARRLYALVANALGNLGVPTDHPVSPASLSARYAHTQWPKSLRREPRSLARWGERAYHGGRVEVWRRGYVERAWETDISSAYPAELARLPHPSALSWSYTRRIHYDAVVGIYRLRVRVSDRLPAGPFPVVVDGRLIYPIGEWDTYVDLWTLRTLMDIQGVSWIVYDGVEGWRISDQLAYPWISRVYQLKQESPSIRLAAKLLMNGLSGKLVQRDTGWRVDANGYRWLADAQCAVSPWERVGPYYRPIAAAHVTGAVRAKVWRTAMTDPDHVIAISTDAIWWSRAPRIDMPGGLGGWSMAIEGVPLCVVGCGIYTYKHCEKWRTVFRGFRTQESLWELLQAAPSNADTITVQTRIPGTLLYGVSTGRINEIGVMPRELTLNMDSKRLWSGSATAGSLRNKLFDSQPHYWYHEPWRCR